jgi:hypothetical protein
MSNLAFEIILRLAKAGVAFIVGTVIFGFLIGPVGATPSAELALLSWLSGAAFILLVESSPI